VKTGEFNEDYTNVPGATVPNHLGEDWIYLDDNGNDVTIGQNVPSLTAGIATTGYSEANGNFVRVTENSGQRTDYFHLQEVGVVSEDRVNVGDTIGRAGDTGVGNAHLHVAQSYPQGTVPVNEEIINAFGRSYVDPMDMPNGQLPQNQSVQNNAQSGGKND
jgi:murein DD-endopeptidase MepM/ murein hydrolase activator NlpD